jgi:hypothetical protein
MELQPNTYYWTRDKRIAYVLGRLPLTGEREHGWVVAYYKLGEYTLFGWAYRVNGYCTLDQSEQSDDLVAPVSAEELEAFYKSEED